MMLDERALAGLADRVGDHLRRDGRTLATAESCTGGWIAKSITDIPGSSAVFAYGVVSYSNGAKESILGVQNRSLEEQDDPADEICHHFLKSEAQPHTQCCCDPPEL